MDLDAYTAARSADWERLSRLAAKRRLDGARGRPTDRPLPVRRGRAVGDPDAAPGRRPSATGCRSRCPRRGCASPAPGRTCSRSSRASSCCSFPPRSTGCAGSCSPSPSRPSSSRRSTPCGSPATRRCSRNFGDGCRSCASYVEHDFIDYYSNNPAASFAGQVWTNNAWIAAQCIAFGITGVYVPYVLLQNAIGVGTAAGVMFAYGRGDVLFSYILPHGLLELTSVFVAAAAGLRIFWAWIAPGARTRGAGARRGRPRALHGRGRLRDLAVRLRADRGLRHAVRPAGVGEDRRSARSRSPRSSSTCWCSAAARCGRARPATSPSSRRARGASSAG